MPGGRSNMDGGEGPPFRAGTLEELDCEMTLAIEGRFVGNAEEDANKGQFAPARPGHATHSINRHVAPLSMFRKTS